MEIFLKMIKLYTLIILIENINEPAANEPIFIRLQRALNQNDYSLVLTGNKD